MILKNLTSIHVLDFDGGMNSYSSGWKSKKHAEHVHVLTSLKTDQLARPDFKWTEHPGAKVFFSFHNERVYQL